MRPSILSRPVVALAVAAWLGGAADAAAQLLLPEQGEGYVSLDYSSSVSNKHYLPTTRYDFGRIDSHVVLADFTYGLTDRLAVSTGLPLVIARYRGEFPHQKNNPDRLDDERWHSTWQDFRFGVSYNAMKGPLVLTPFAAAVVPSHGYEYLAHSAAGRHLRELQAGVALGALLNQLRPGLYLQSRCSFAFVEQQLNVRPNHSNVDVEFGYVVKPALRVFVLSSGQLSHGGIDVYPSNPGFTPEQVHHHDQIARVNYLHLGAGASIDLTQSIALYGAFNKQVAGRNGHEVTRAISLGVTWSFRTQKQTLFGATAAGPASPTGWSSSRARAGT